MEKIGVSDYKVKEYKGFSFLRFIAVIESLYIANTFRKGKELLEFYKPNTFIRLFDTWDLFDILIPAFTSFSIILFVGMALMYIANGFAAEYGHRVFAIMDIIADVCCLLALVFYVVIYIVPCKLAMYIDLKCIFLVMTFIVLLFVHISVVRKAYNHFEDDNKALVVIMSIAMAGIIIASGVFAGKIIVAGRDFVKNYREYVKVEHGRVVSMENEMGNFRYGGVNGDGVFYMLSYDKDTKENQILEVDKNKNISVLYSTDSGIAYMYYDEGNLYVLKLDNDWKIVKINVQTSEEKTVLCDTDEIRLENYGIRDGYIYYAANVDDKENIYVAPLSDIDDAKLYIGNASSFYELVTYSRTCAFHYMIVCDDRTVYDDIDYHYRDSTEQPYGEGIWFLKPDYYYLSPEYPLYKYPASLVCLEKEGKEEVFSIDEVTAYNIYDDILYYTLSTDEGYELYKAALNGDNPTLLEAKNDGSKVDRIMVTPDFIICNEKNEAFEGEGNKLIIDKN